MKPEVKEILKALEVEGAVMTSNAQGSEAAAQQWRAKSATMERAAQLIRDGAAAAEGAYTVGESGARVLRYLRACRALTAASVKPFSVFDVAREAGGEHSSAVNALAFLLKYGGVVLCADDAGEFYRLAPGARFVLDIFTGDFERERPFKLNRPTPEQVEKFQAGGTGTVAVLIERQVAVTRALRDANTRAGDVKRVAIEYMVREYSDVKGVTREFVEGAFADCANADEVIKRLASADIKCHAKQVCGG